MTSYTAANRVEEHKTLLERQSASTEEEEEPSIELLELWNAHVARQLTTWDGRDRTESVEALISGSTTEEEQGCYHSELKLNWPAAQTYGSLGEPEWDKRDFIHLYKKLAFKVVGTAFFILVLLNFR